jgi:membrane-associated phospholipid phosphatase
MIVSVFTEGAHYGVDMLSGFALAFIVLEATVFLLKRCSSHGRAEKDARHAHAV